MLGVVDLPTYLIGLVLIVLLPGPNSVYVLSVAARRGVGAGYRAAAGVWTGDAVLMVLSAAGVASLLRANDLLFGVVRWAGAAYLAYLAFGMLRGAIRTWRQRHEQVEQIISEPASIAESPYRRALMVSLLNPKAILFFVAFFVQFVDPAYAHPALSFAFLGLLCQIVSALYLSVLIFTGTRLADSFRRRRRLAAGATSAVGAAFLAFAVKLTLA